MLTLSKRSGINDIPAYCDLRQCAASNSDLCDGSPLTIPTFLKVGTQLKLVGRSGINDIRNKTTAYIIRQVYPDIPLFKPSIYTNICRGGCMCACMVLRPAKLLARELRHPCLTCPSRNITRNCAVYSNNMKKHRKSYYFITQPKGHN